MKKKTLSDKEIISAYHVNTHGTLCYSGLPTSSDHHPDLTFENHNGEPYGYQKRYGKSRYTYEVGGVTQYALWHGQPFRKFDNNYILSYGLN